MNVTMSKTEAGMAVVNPAVDKDSTVSEKVTTEFRKDESGTVTIASLPEKEDLDDSGKTDLHMLKTPGGSVMAEAGEENESKPSGEESVLDDEHVVSEEVSWDEVSKTNSISADIVEALDVLVELERDEVDAILDGLVEEGKIGSYRIVGPGQSYTQDFVPDRVQLLTDHNGLVQDVHLG